MKMFSVERANALIVRVGPLVEELLAKRRDLAITILESHAHVEGVGERTPHLASARGPFPVPRFGDRKSEIVRLIHRIEAFGCIVKDIDLGLVDFPSVRDGRPIFLCWKAGEPHVAFWHGNEEGFQSRKPLEESDE